MGKYHRCRQMLALAFLRFSPIRQSFTYPIVQIYGTSRLVGMVTKANLPLDERLLILRATDQSRTWTSLDDKRVCILCERKFSGRQVGVARGRGGRIRLHCPTEGCSAGPDQWVYPGNPLVSEAAYRDWQRALGVTDTQPSSAELSSAA